MSGPTTKNILIDPKDVSVPPEIKEAAIMGNLTIFVGNGVSRLYGLPSWNGLADAMLKSLVNNKQINHNTHELLLKYPIKTKISIADRFFKQNLATGAYSDMYYGSMLKVDEAVKKKIFTYSLIAKCGCKFITTNYDLLFAEALNGNLVETGDINRADVENQGSQEKIAVKKSQSYEVISSLNDFSKTNVLEKNFLVHLHGSLSDESKIVASTADYLNLYSNEDNRDKLTQIFDKQTVVFIGYGLDELEILEFIFKAANRESGSQFYLLLSLLSHELEVIQHLEQYYKEQLNVTLLTYCRDQEGYLALNQVVENWAKELEGLVQSPNQPFKFRVLEGLMKDHEKADL